VNAGLAAPTVRRAITSHLAGAAADPASQMHRVRVLEGQPDKESQLRTVEGKYEVVYPVTDASGTSDVQVLTAGRLRFDETVIIEFRIEVLPVTNADTADVTETRANEILYAVLSEISNQRFWSDREALGLEAFDYVWFTPATIEIVTTRVEGKSGYGCGIALGIEVQARRGFPV